MDVTDAELIAKYKSTVQAEFFLYQKHVACIDCYMQGLNN